MRPVSRGHGPRPAPGSTRPTRRAASPLLRANRSSLAARRPGLCALTFGSLGSVPARELGSHKSCSEGHPHQETKEKIKTPKEMPPHTAPMRMATHYQNRKQGLRATQGAWSPVLGGGEGKEIAGPPQSTHRTHEPTRHTPQGTEGRHAGCRRPVSIHRAGRAAASDSKGRRTPATH